jgi:hypothetical protein
MGGAEAIVMVAWMVVATPDPDSLARAGGPTIPTVVQAEPASEWNRKFANKEGWIGGDGAYSVVLGPRRVLWLFGDSILGKVEDGQRTGAVMVNNAIGIQAGPGEDAAIRFVTGKTKDGKPDAFFTPQDDKGWFWPQAAIRRGDRLYVFLSQLSKTKEAGAFGFQPLGQWLAVVANPDDDPRDWRVKCHPMPFASFEEGRERSWGSAVLAEDENLYVYGYQQEGKGIGKRRLTVARVPAEKVENWKAWRFWTTKEWSNQPRDAAPLASGLATEFSVSRLPGWKGYVATYVENGLGERIVGRFAEAPEGPWSDPSLLYVCSEMGKDKGVFTYAAKAHPWAAGKDELLVSYCVNAWKFARLFQDEAVYRPRFVRVRFGPPK